MDVKYSDNRDYHVSGHTNVPEMIDFYKQVKPLLVFPMHGETRHLLAHKKLLAEKNIRSEIIRNGEIVEIGSNLKLEKNTANRSEKLFVDGQIIASSDNMAFKERIKMSSNGFLVVEVDHLKREKKFKIEITAYGLPRFEDYCDELKTNAENYINKLTKNNGQYDKDEIEKFVKRDIYTFCGKKPLIKIAGLR